MNDSSQTSAHETVTVQQDTSPQEDGEQKTGLPAEASARRREDRPEQVEPALLQEATNETKMMAEPETSASAVTSLPALASVKTEVKSSSALVDATASAPTASAAAVLAAPFRPLSDVRPEELSPVLGKVRVLTADEREMYRKCEVIVREGWEKWFQAGLALAQIHDADLYREEFGKFEDYVERRWGIHRTRAYALMDAAKLAQILANDPDVPRPDHETPLRPLIPLPVEEAKLVWQCAAANSAGRPITGRLIKSTMKTLQIQPKKKGPERVRINKAEQRKVVNQVLEQLIVLITAKAAHCELLQKAEFLHHRLQELFAPSKPSRR